jgi:hypothetical protein
MACLSACCVVLLTGRDVATTLFCCQTFMPGKAWVAMALEVCLVGVALMAWREPRRRVLGNVDTLGGATFGALKGGGVSSWDNTLC